MAEQITGAAVAANRKEQAAAEARDRTLAPIQLHELRDALQILSSRSGYRCSDRGFLKMTSSEYIELLDWTARCIVPGKRGATPEDAPAVFERLGLGLWVALACQCSEELYFQGRLILHCLLFWDQQVVEVTKAEN